MEHGGWNQKGGKGKDGNNSEGNVSGGASGSTPTVIGTVANAGGGEPEKKNEGNIDAVDWDEQEGNDWLHRWILSVEPGSPEDDWEPLDEEQVLEALRDGHEEESDEPASVCASLRMSPPLPRQ